ncbi:MAG: hypothetical protein ACRDU4_19275, partial [Mycobacterium sp.]
MRFLSAGQLWVTLTFALFVPRTSTAQFCNPCSPQMGSSMSGGVRTVFIDTSTIDATDYGTIWSAFPTLEGSIDGLRGMVDYQLTGSAAGASIVIVGVAIPDPSRPTVGATTNADGNGGGYIKIKTDYLNGQYTNLMFNMAVHEAGHTANFHDLDAASNP